MILYRLIGGNIKLVDNADADGYYCVMPSNSYENGRVFEVENNKETTLAHFSALRTKSDLQKYLNKIVSLRESQKEIDKKAELFRRERAGMKK